MNYARFAAPAARTRGAAARLWRHTFKRAVAVIYTAGAIVHVLRLYYRFGWAEMPFYPDWILVILGPYAALGMIVFADDVQYRGRWEVVIHWLITAHLLASVGLHAWILVTHSHRVVSVFSYSYSYFAAFYFGVFAWRSWTLRLKPGSDPPL